jgi:hypothetical protein
MAEDLRNHFADVLARTGHIFFNPVIIEDHHIISRYIEQYVANASETYLLIEPWLEHHVRHVRQRKSFNIACISKPRDDVEQLKDWFEEVKGKLWTRRYTRQREANEPGGDEDVSDGTNGSDVDVSNEGDDEESQGGIGRENAGESEGERSDTPLPRTSSAAWSVKLTPGRKELTSKQHSVWRLPPSFDLESLHGIPGHPIRISPTSLVKTSPSIPLP